MQLSINSVTTQHLGHLGLIAAIIKKLKIVERIDLRIPVSKEHGAIVSMGQRVSAMILNGLGFLNDRLYMHSIFFEDKPVSRLLGENINAGNINDDALGRALDAIFEYGTTKLFCEIAFEIAREHNLLGRTARLDSTSISVYGEYEGSDREEAIDITYGFSKDKRYDLKQFILSLTNSGKSGHPLWMEALSGNTADKASFQETVRKIEAFKQQLRDAPDFIYVADSALYVPGKLLESSNLRWLTRVPESVKEAADLVKKNDSEFVWISLNNGYKYHELTSNYGGVSQRWQLIYSEQAFLRERKTLMQRISKKNEELKKTLWHLGAQIFSCESDLHAAIKPILKKLKYHSISYTLEKVTKHTKKGRPKANEEPNVVGYKIVTEISEEPELIKIASNKLGRFILATNELDLNILPSDCILKEYKSLDKVEKGFRFIKSTEFAMSSVFLKTPSRIEALMMVMTLCLMVYNFGEHAFRKSLSASNDTIPNQLGKQTKNPTMRWTFRIMDKVTIAYISTGDTLKFMVANICNVCCTIIKHFGKEAMEIYGII